MAYHFEDGEAASAGLARMAREQIDAAIGEIARESLEAHETVYRVRKRCKDQRRGELRRGARAAGMRLYAERPGALTARLAACWSAWRLEHPSLRAAACDEATRAAG